MKAVMVELTDMAFSTGTWNVNETKTFGPVTIHTVGWLVEDRQDCIILAEEWQISENQWRHLTAIPKINIIAVHTLHVGKGPKGVK